MPSDDYSLLEHLKLVQGVISRMGQNSFALKGWSVTLVAALMALAVNTHRRSYALLALFPSVIFWVLTPTTSGRSATSGTSTTKSAPGRGRRIRSRPHISRAGRDSEGG